MVYTAYNRLIGYCGYNHISDERVGGAAKRDFSLTWSNRNDMNNSMKGGTYYE